MTKEPLLTWPKEQRNDSENKISIDIFETMSAMKYFPYISSHNLMNGITTQCQTMP